jgi:NADH:ubiquinone oxidoreductase subunit F (NADH-binding)
MSGPNGRSQIPDGLVQLGGLFDGVSRQVAAQTKTAEADVYGVASFFHLLAEPETKVRVCQGLSCRMNGAEALLKAAQDSGLPASGCQCLAACDQPVAVLRERRVLPALTLEDITEAKGDYLKLHSSKAPNDTWRGHVGPSDADSQNLALNLLGETDYSATAFARAKEMGTDAVIQTLQDSGLQGRGGAGFPAHIKWRAVANHSADKTKYLVLNADEGEPGTFKDREVMVRRPDIVIEGLAIAAHAIGAQEIYCYLRGEFEIPWEAMEAAIAKFEAKNAFGDLKFHLHAGHGAYICGEETALLEALEGKRGMPRLKPPFPTDVGLWGQPTLIHNVETIGCVPGIINRGDEWFKALGREEAGSKLYCISGHVKDPGVYEMPLGVSLDELVEAAGGYLGKLKSFSPGGASAGFLPASMSDLPLDFKSLGKAGSMLGSAGVVVLNDTVSMRWAVGEQLEFFEIESCGQCAPCRIGTRFLKESLQRGTASAELVDDVAWEMAEGSICGLGQAAALPLTSAMKWFPKEFE